ncbi:MAG: hypothetical protein JWQ35_1789 [Bacteriovoracaceae bacterium]|nr:hypothetical protein [Bacteriovoracaceae bacterium]
MLLLRCVNRLRNIFNSVGIGNVTTVITCVTIFASYRCFAGDKNSNKHEVLKDILCSSFISFLSHPLAMEFSGAQEVIDLRHHGKITYELKREKYGLDPKYTAVLVKPSGGHEPFEAKSQLVILDPITYERTFLRLIGSKDNGLPEVEVNFEKGRGIVGGHVKFGLKRSSTTPIHIYEINGRGRWDSPDVFSSDDFLIKMDTKGNGILIIHFFAGRAEYQPYLPSREAPPEIPLDYLRPKQVVFKLEQGNIKERIDSQFEHFPNH